MSPAEYLAAAAQVGVALAGFTGVVVALDERSLEQWSTVDRFKLRLLVTFSAAPLVQCLLALLILSIGSSESVVWRVASLAAVSIVTPITVDLLRRFRLIPFPRFRAEGGSTAIFFIGGMIGTLLVLFQIANVFMLARFWPFFAFVIGQYVAAIVQFVRFILSRAGSSL